MCVYKPQISVLVEETKTNDRPDWYPKECGNIKIITLVLEKVRFFVAYVFSSYPIS